MNEDKTVSSGKVYNDVAEVNNAEEQNNSKETKDKTYDLNLKEGTVLDNRYRILRVIGIGGFGITYEALNEKANIRVAIKEFYDREYLTRDQKELVLMNSWRQDEFKSAKEKFLKEARHLGDFSDESGVVSVIDYFEENNTAYIVMEYLSGFSLKEYFAREKRVESTKLFHMFFPLMQTLDKIHKSGVLHRDISPDNIKFDGPGEESMKLIDFGSAREYTNNNTYTVELKHGYAPIEQYDGHELGPWTDVYALSAVLYEGITGERPVNSTIRVVQDKLQMPSQMGIKIDPRLEKILKKGLAVRKEKRYQSVEEMILELSPILKPKKKPIRKEKIFLAASCIVCVLVALSWGAWNYYQNHLAFFKFHGEKTETVMITPYGEVSSQDYQKDMEIMQQRLEYLFGSENYIAKEVEDGLEVVMPLSYFEELDYDDLEEAVDEEFSIVAAAHKMSVAVIQSDEDIYSKFDIDREDIVSAKKKLGDLPIEYYLPENIKPQKDIVGYVEVTLTDEASLRLQKELKNKLISNNESSEKSFMRLILDLEERDATYYRFCTDPAGDWSVFYYLLYSDNNRWKSLWKTSELSNSYCVTSEIPVQWEESSGMWGDNQCKENEIELPAVCSEYENNNYDATDDTGAWLQIVYDIKTKMDALKIPYAFGLGSGDNKKIVIKTAQKDTNEAIRQSLTHSLGSSLGLVTEEIMSDEWDDLAYTDISFDDADQEHCKLTFKLDEESSFYGLDSFNEWKNERSISGDDKIYLMYEGYPLSILSVEETEDTSELVFEKNLWREEEIFTSEDIGIAEFLKQSQVLDSDSNYYLSKTQYITKEQKVSINASDIKDLPKPKAVEKLTEVLQSLGEEVEIITDDGFLNKWSISVSLNLDTEGRFADQMTSFIENFIEENSSYLKNVRGIEFHPGNELDWLVVSIYWDSYSNANNVTIYNINSDNSEHLKLEENIDNSEILKNTLDLTNDTIRVSRY